MKFLLRASSGCRVQSQGMDTAVWFKCLEIQGVKFELQISHYLLINLQFVIITVGHIDEQDCDGTQRTAHRCFHIVVDAWK
jgi:hypothetical protein